MGDCYLMRHGGVLAGLPRFKYTGNYTLVDDGEVSGGGRNWRIRFLTSGVFTPSNTMTVDLFLVGGGGSGDPVNDTASNGWGGGGGYTKTVKSLVMQGGQSYNVVVGAGAVYSGTRIGGSSSMLGNSVNGGNKQNGGSAGGRPGAYDYAGGNGGSNGSDSGSGGWTAYGSATGQGTTTREFGESTGALYAGGGAGRGTSNNFGNGGSGGGGQYGHLAGYTNTGGGSASKNSGGSGIVIIRNHRG